MSFPKFFCLLVSDSVYLGYCSAICCVIAFVVLLFRFVGFDLYSLEFCLFRRFGILFDFVCSA